MNPRQRGIDFLTGLTHTEVLLGGTSGGMDGRREAPESTEASLTIKTNR